MDIGNALEVMSIVMLNGSEKTDMLWQADAMSLSNVKQFWKQAKRYGTWRTKAIFFRVLDLAKSIYSIFTLFFYQRHPNMDIFQSKMKILNGGPLIGSTV